ncbi:MULTISPECIES: hypothetical protein [Fischerella]|uniref:hypothetical protein n=1 Tax=Fischerella TaxID=1190 RepID=UPI00071F7462|nr:MULTISPECIES: hypothetical protein [Fischerella]BAU06670.1 menaquinone-specific isochorismate synthase [Fischerella sp. NIES-3754]BCX08973.1 MAG: hypothetical protein KatS3mg066_2832 [Fischerella sp.]
MTNTTNKSGIWQRIIETPQKVVRYIYGGVVRIFTPRDDNYPETGVQPFEGEIDKERH